MAPTIYTVCPDCKHTQEFTLLGFIGNLWVYICKCGKKIGYPDYQ